MTCRPRANQPRRVKWVSFPSDLKLPKNDRLLHRPKTLRAQEPIDMGDQVFMSGACNMVLHPLPDPGQPSAKASLTTPDLKSMCQKRLGTWRSMMRRRPHTTTRGKAIQ